MIRLARWAVTKAATPVLAWLERLSPLDLLPDTEADDERAYRLAQVEDAANEVWGDVTCFIGHMQGWESEWVEYRETELMGGQS